MIFKVSSGKFIYIYSFLSSSETLHNKLILIGANLFWNAIKWRSSGVRSQKIVRTCPHFSEVWEVRTNSTADDFRSADKFYCVWFSKCHQENLYIYIYIYSLVSLSETLHNKLILIGANLFWNAIKWRSSGVRSQKIVRTCPHFSEVWEVRTNSTADDFRSADKFYCRRFSKCGQILLRTIFEVRTNSTADDFRSADKFYCGRFSKCGQILLRTIFEVRTILFSIDVSS